MHRDRSRAASLSTGRLGPRSGEEKKHPDKVSQHSEAAALAAKNAVGQERVRQQLRAIATKTGFALASVRGLYSNWIKHIEPFKMRTENLVEMLDEPLNHQRRARTEQLEAEYEKLGASFCQQILSPQEDNPFQLFSGSHESVAIQLHAECERLTFEDYMDTIEHLVKQGKAEDRLLFLFQTVDRDGDGEISHTELMELLSEHSSGGLGKQQAIYTWVKKNFQLADVDRSGTLDFYECLSILRKNPAILSDLRVNVDAVVQSFAR